MVDALGKDTYHGLVVMLADRVTPEFVLPCALVDRVNVRKEPGVQGRTEAFWGGEKSESRE